VTPVLLRIKNRAVHGKKQLEWSLLRLSLSAIHYISYVLTACSSLLHAFRVLHCHGLLETSMKDALQATVIASRQDHCLHALLLLLFLADITYVCKHLQCLCIEPICAALTERQKRRRLTDDWNSVARCVGDDGGPLYLYDDVRLSLDLRTDVTDHVMADNRHVGGQTTNSQDRCTVDGHRAAIQRSRHLYAR